MDSFVHLGLLNAALATLLALVAAVARYLRCRPAVVHALWLLVLLKLLTPPFVAVPIRWLPRPQTNSDSLVADSSEAKHRRSALLSRPVGSGEPTYDASVRSSEVSDRAARDVPPVTTDLSPPQKPGFSAAAPTTLETPISEFPADPTDSLAEVENPPSAPSYPMPSWEQIVAAVWLAGALVWWTVAAVRLVRFRLSLRSAWPAPAALQERAERLAARLGLSRCPRIYVLPASIMPLLWAVAGKPCLLIPAVLWARLNHEQQDTLLAHELAHLRRGDPWVRRLEIIVLGLYWWLPIVWWARHELQEAEEQCCDAWVVWTLPAAAEAYAAALLETVAFLSRLRPALPLGASGAGHTRLLRRRLTMILKGTAPRALSWTTFGAMLACAAVLLPLRPTWGQGRPTTAAGAGQEKPALAQTAPAATSAVGQSRPAATRSKLADTGRTSDGGVVGSISHPSDIEEAKDQVELLEVQLEGKKAELLESQARVEQTHRQVNRQQALLRTNSISQEEVDQSRTELTVREARVRVKQTQIKEAEIRLRQAKRWLARLQSGRTGAGNNPSTNPFTSTATYGETRPPSRSVAGPATSGVGSQHAPSASVATRPSDTVGKAIEGAAASGAGDRRLRELEKKLDALLKEVENLRREIRRQPAEGGASGAAKR